MKKLLLLATICLSGLTFATDQACIQVLQPAYDPKT
jgi:hypothetical protein